MGTTAQKLSYLKETKEQIMEKVNNIDGNVTDNTTFRQGTQKVVDVYNYYNNESETLTPQQTTGKANYLKETKRLYKEAINLFDENITNQTTFREYPDKLDDIYNNLPKVEIEGNDFQLQDTKAGKLLLTPKGNTIQTQLTGKNLCDISLLPITQYGITISKNSNGNIIINGTPDYSDGYKSFRIGTDRTIPAGQYSVSIDTKINGIGFANGIPYAYLSMGDTVRVKTTTTSENSTITPIINIRYDVGTLNNFILNPQVEVGTPTDYEQYCGGVPSPNPSYPQDIKVVTGENNIIVRGLNIESIEKELNLSSKNKFDKNNALIGKEIQGNTIADSPNWVVTDYIKVKPNTHYIKSGANAQGRAILLYDKNYNYIDRIDSGTDFITPNNSAVEYIITNFPINYLNTFQLEEGSTATEYEPYYNYELAKLPDINYINNNKLVKSTYVSSIVNNIATSISLTATGSTGCLITFPEFTPEVGDYYVSADIRLKSGACEAVRNLQIWARDTWNVSSSWYETPATPSNSFQRYIVKYTVSNIGASTNTVYGFYVQLTNPNNAIIEFKNIQISKINVDYTPYGTNSDSIIKTTGKNLLDISKVERGKSYNYGTTGQVPTESSSSQRATLSPTNAISVKPLTTYIITIPSGYRVAVAELDNDKVSLGDSGWQSDTSYIITTQSNTHYIGFNFSKSDNGAFSDADWNNFIIREWQLEKGTISTSYEPYGTNIWYKKQIIKSKVYDENNNFQLGSASTNDYYVFQTDYRYDISDAKQIGNSLICDNFKFSDIEENYQREYIAINPNAYSYVRFHISASRLSEKSVEAFRNWLETHNVLIYYILENPIYTQITDTTLISQLEEINSIIGKGGTVVIETESEEENAQLIVNAKALAKVGDNNG